MRSSRGSRRAFTMLELILCIVVLSVCLIPIFDLLLSETRQTGFVSDRVVALALGRSVVERYRVETLDWLRANLATPQAGAARIRAEPLLTPLPGDDVPRDFLETLGQYGRQVVFEPDPTDARKGVLRCVVSWRSRQSDERRIEVAVVLADTDFPAGRE